jgi:cob(I)alamin adenosyltransferase
MNTPFCGAYSIFKAMTIIAFQHFITGWKKYWFPSLDLSPGTNYTENMLIVFTGNGKGKTTAALGQAARMVGRGRRVLMIQFIKGPWKSGEDYIDIVTRDKRHVTRDEGFFELRKRGLGFVGILGDKLPREEHEKAAKEALNEFKVELASGKWDLIILDEINNAVHLGLLSVQDVLDAIKDMPKEKFVIFTGRDAPQEFIERADLVTEMKEIKHPFNDGEMAKIAVEF